MRQTIKAFILAIAAAMLAVPASAQFIGYVSPQGVTAEPFNNVTTAQTSAPIIDAGQTIHFLNYIVNTASAVQIHLEGSFDGVTYSTISDDATSRPKGQVLAVGYYPYIRANLVVCVSCTNFTAFYAGTSSSPGNVFGDIYDVSQQIKKPLFNLASLGTTATATINSTPYGSPAGYLVFAPTGVVIAGSTLSVVANGISSVTLATFNLATTATLQSFPVPANPTGFNNLQVTFTSGGADANLFTCYYVFFPPGAAIPSGSQPPGASNSESTGTNTIVTKTLVPAQGQRGHVFSVSARCGAGTSTLTITDGATTIWSTGGGMIGTTNFDKTWPVGLAGSPNNTVTVSLASCGVSNVGVLDVQGSIF